MTSPATPEPARPLLWTLAEACEQLRMSKARAYRLASQGKLQILKDGGRNFVADAELRRYAASLSEAEVMPWSQRRWHGAARSSNSAEPTAPATARRRSSSRRRSA